MIEVRVVEDITWKGNYPSKVNVLVKLDCKPTLASIRVTMFKNFGGTHAIKSVSIIADTLVERRDLNVQFMASRDVLY